MAKYRLEYDGEDPEYFTSKDEFIRWVVYWMAADSSIRVKFYYPDGSWYGDEI